MDKFKRFAERFGWRGFVSLMFYPIITLITTPIRLCQTLWNSRILADGRDWGNYPHFSSYSALNGLFYWTAALNLCRFGRSGTSPYIGLGNYRLTRFFHYSMSSLYFYWKAGAVSLLVGMFGWWTGHFLWLDQPGISWSWVILVMVLALFSTTFYSNAFVLQNYNVLGWLFVPAALYGWLSEHWALASIAWLGASFASFTVTILAGVFSIMYSFQLGSYLPIITIIPAGVKLMIHLRPSFGGREFANSFSIIAKAVGMGGRKTKYSRTGTKSFGATRLYFLILYTQFIAIVYLHQAKVPVMFILAVVIWLVNSRFIRFADDQTMHMLFFSLSTAIVIQSNAFNLWFLASYWLLISPLPRLLGSSRENSLSVTSVFRPTNIALLLKEFEKFLSPVSKGQRVLMTLENPRNRYEAIFDGFGVLLQLPSYVASEKMIHFIPDWYGVFELNYWEAPDFWGREVDEVERQMKYWKADYVIVYQENEAELDEKWGLNGFREISHFSWLQFDGFFSDLKPYPGSPPEWWLLKKASAGDRQT